MGVRNFLLGVRIWACLAGLLLFNSAGPAWADNAKFYGDYGGTQKVGSCDDEEVTWTVGNDPVRSRQDNYLYVLPDSDETSFSWVDNITFDTVERTITVDGDTLHLLEIGGSIKDSNIGWTEELAFAFSNNLKNVGLSGTVSDNREGACQGNVTGNLTKEEEQDNAKYYGTFDYTLDWFGSGECPETGTVRIGNDYTRTCEEDYLYIPASGDEASYSCTDKSDSWTTHVWIAEGNINWQETGECKNVPSPCWTTDVTMSFGALYLTGTLSGYNTEADPDACQGIYTGFFEKLDEEDEEPKKGGGGGSDGPCFVSTLARGLAR